MNSDSDDEIYLEALKEKAKQILNMGSQVAVEPTATTSTPKPKKKKEQTEEAKAKTLLRLQELRERSRANKGLTLTPDSMKPKRVYNKPIEKPVEPTPPPQPTQPTQPTPPPQPTQTTQPTPPPQPVSSKSYFIPKSKYNMKTFGF